MSVELSLVSGSSMAVIFDKLSAAELGRLFASGKVDPVEATEFYLHRAKQTEAVFIAVTEKRARLEAEAARTRWKAGFPLSSLDGVPIAWKDLFDVRQTVTTAGSAIFRNQPPATRDAALVVLAARAGIVCLGKTNLPELAYSGIGMNPHFGTPANPHSREVARVPGGSSSGSAVALALGAVPLAVGSDTGGSIRVPCAFNGLVGFRSSIGRLSLDGLYPVCPSLDTAGPIARTVEDCVILDAVFRGILEAPDHADLSLHGQRFVVESAVLNDDRVEASVRQNLEHMVDSLVCHGAMINRRSVPSIQEALDLHERYGWFAAPEILAQHEALLATKKAEMLDLRVRRRLESARGFSAVTLVRLWHARKRLRDQIAADLDGATLVMPTVAHVPPPL
ncbi:MAG TPA: amidase family protein, partial [Chthoniobacterales bacterium]|nr:amidase family protein [Chthoniobacterales bacterium]